MQKKNSLNENFIELLITNVKEWILPMVKNVTTSNMGILKEIFGNENEKLRLVKQKLFEFVMFYYLQEQFGNVEEKENVFWELKGLLEFLAKVKPALKFSSNKI
jgi:hypothetical protein